MSVKQWRHEMEHAFRNLFFVHIPKTGGTTVEAEMALRGTANNTVIHAVRECCAYRPGFAPVEHCCRPGPPWHLAPDVFEQAFNLTLGAPATPTTASRRKRFCIVREPGARYASFIRWDLRVHRNVSGGPMSTRVTGPLEQLAAEFENGRWHVQWSSDHAEILVHLQPQSWFVWAAEGRVECDCVVAIEKLARVLPKRLNRASDPSSADTLPRALQLLYRGDAALWQKARNSTDFCYRPPAERHHDRQHWCHNRHRQRHNCTLNVSRPTRFV